MVVFDLNDSIMPVSIESEKLTTTTAPPLNATNRSSSCMKRSKLFGVANSVSFNPYKKVCLSPSLTRRNSATLAALYSNSSESETDNDSQNDKSYSNNQRLARKRAFSIKSRSLSFADEKLNKAISKYSDDDAEEAEEHHDVSYSEDVDSKIQSLQNAAQSSPLKTPLNSPVAKKKEIGGFFQEPCKSSRRSSAGGDQVARNRCFEYLIGAIDEVWARYCDVKSYAEDEVYHNDTYSSNSALPNTPASMALSEGDDDDEDENESDDIDDGYKSASTNVTEYESEMEKTGRSSLKLQNLKDRLMKAKYYLQDFLDTFDEEECVAFWKRWDLVKYATIELVEDDDDDEVIESTIEDLEKGRLYFCE